ncbi:MAG: mechanosensitive ion channel, partial [Rhodothermaceae bacterium]|nr:mechanosensitive ion channel [Rhodothermaceae bacterium]
FRTTRIRQDDSSIVCVPNQTFTGSFITNYSERRGRVIKYEFGILPSASPSQLESFLEQARALLKEHVNVREDSVEVHLTGFGEWAVQVRIKVFTVSTGWSLFLDTRQELLLGLLRVLDELGLALARPSRSLYVHNTPDFALSDGDGAREALAPPSEDAPS